MVAGIVNHFAGVLEDEFVLAPRRQRLLAETPG